MLVLSEDSELMSTRPNLPPEDEPIEIVLDDEPGPIEPEAPPPLTACLPPTAAASLVLVEPATARICFNRDSNSMRPDDACLWVGKDGAVRVDVPPAAEAAGLPRVSVASDRVTAQLCDPAGQCRTLTTAKPIQQAITDASGERAALLLQESDLDGGTVEIYDVRDGKRVATGTRRWRKDKKVSYEIAFVGTAILWIEYPGAVEPGHAELWKTKGKKLKKRTSFDHQVHAWGELGDERVVFGMEGTRLEVWNIKKAKRTAKLELDQLVPNRRERDAWRASNDGLQLAYGDGVFAAMAQTPMAARVAFVDVAQRKPRSTIVEIPACR